MERGPDDPLHRYQPAVRRINEHETEMRAKTDDEFRAMTDELKARLRPQPRTHIEKLHLCIVPKSGETS